MISLLLALSLTASAQATKNAVFAGGCFWCMQASYDYLKKKNAGVIATTVGYSGGAKENPTYEDVSTGKSGHLEVIEVVYDPKKITYAKLVEVFWENVDPTDSFGQFCDKGEQYQAAIFYADDEQKKEAEKSLAAIKKTQKAAVVTKILPLKKFFKAEEYHQGYHEKNPVKYNLYATGCGRTKRLKEVWGKAPKH